MVVWSHFTAAALCTSTIAVAAHNLNPVTVTKEIRGAVLGLGEWAYLGPTTDPVSTDDAEWALARLKAIGGNTVRLIPTGFFSNASSPDVFTIPSGPYRSTQPEEVASISKTAHSLGLRVLLSPVIDPDWRLASNCRGTGCSKETFVSRLMLGEGFSDVEWTHFFASYRNFLGPYLVAANASSAARPDVISVAAELQTAATKAAPQHWKDLCAWIRQQLPGVPLTYAAITSSITGPGPTISWLSELDQIGVDAYFPLDIHVPGQQRYWPDNFTAPSVQQFVQAWEPIVQQLQLASQAAGNKPLLFCEVGYQSRFGAWNNPPGVLTLDPTDGSCWERAVNLEVQQRMYHALLEVMAEHSVDKGGWWQGVAWWILRADRTGGGTADDSFQFVGKPAEQVLAKAWGGQVPAEGEPGSLQSPTKVAMQALEKVDSWQETNGTTALTIGSRTAKNATKVNSAVFGAGMWSSPGYPLGSAGALESLKDLRSTGANFVRIITNWFGDDVGAFTIWPGNGTSPLRSSTRSEIVQFAKQARDLGIKCHLAPYIDPNFDSPSVCRGPSCGRIPGTPPKQGRGQFGEGFTPQQWADWFDPSVEGSYGAFMLEHAVTAEMAGCDMLSVGSELAAAFESPQADWKGLIDQVRAVFSGQVTAALGGGLCRKSPPPTVVQYLDFIGCEGYYSLHVHGDTTGNPTVEQLVEAWQPIVADLAKLPKPVMFTEVGYQTRTDTTAHPASSNSSDVNDCSVTPRCAIQETQANAYEALLQALYPQPWFMGVNWWLWRSDPTAGGLTDYTFPPQGKPLSLAAMKRWYAWYA